jgi:hypothetical protein
MNTETITDKTGVITPNDANANRVQMVWYSSPQNPDIKNSPKQIRDRWRYVMSEITLFFLPTAIEQISYHDRLYSNVSMVNSDAVGHLADHD